MNQYENTPARRVMRCGRVGSSLLALTLTAACSLGDASPPPLQGPSELALAFSLLAIPDVLTLDGASQSQIVIDTRDASGQPLGNVTFRIDTVVDGVIADYGALSARTLVTNGSGRATAIYTAPLASAVGVDTGDTVSLRVTPFGTNFANTVTRWVTIRLIPPGILLPGGPTPAFTVSPTAPQAFTDVLFDASGSTSKPSTTITSYTWDFGDGGTGNGRTITHRFSPGTYLVTLTVTDSNNISATAQQTVTVAAGPQPIAKFVFSPTAPLTGQSVLFDASQSTPGTGRTLVSYDWTFGTGNTGSARSGMIVTKTFSTPASYSVVLTVTDDVGQTATAAQTVAVVAGLTPAFTISPTNPASGETVQVNASGSTAPPGATITSYTWDFGNGQTGTGVAAQTSYTVAAARTFVIRLTVTDSTGNKATTTSTVSVTP